MASSWDAYYVIFLSAVLSLCVPAGLSLLSILFFSGKGSKGSKKRAFRRDLTQDAHHHAGTVNRTVLGKRINVRFFLAANAALVLFALALELIPCAVTLHSTSPGVVSRGLIAIVSIAGFSVLGLLYAVRKGDMSWLSSFESAFEMPQVGLKGAHVQQSPNGSVPLAEVLGGVSQNLSSKSALTGAQVVSGKEGV